MASLVKNGDNYGLIWTDKSRSQPQTRESLKTSSKKEARRLKARLENEYYEGKHDPWRRKWYERSTQATELTLGAAVEQFISYKTKTRGREGWNDTTQKREVPLMRKFARYVGENIPVESLTERHLEDFYYRDSVTSGHTRDSDYISVNTFLNWCIDRDIISEKPEFRPKKPQKKVPKYIHPKDLGKLILGKINHIESAIKNETIHDPKRAGYWVVLGWMILAGTGMRPKELVNLKLQHIEDEMILIGGDFTTKVRAERKVPMLFESKQAVQLLTDPHYRQLDRSMRDSDYLLGRKPNYCQSKLSRDFTNTWRQVFPDRPKRTLYNLKDMFCVRFLSDDSVASRTGMKLNDLKEIVGHASLTTTEKYLKAVPYGTSIDGTIWDYVHLHVSV